MDNAFQLAQMTALPAITNVPVLQDVLVEYSAVAATLGERIKPVIPVASRAEITVAIRIAAKPEIAALKIAAITPRP